jgi:hypothetical protein
MTNVLSSCFLAQTFVNGLLVHICHKALLLRQEISIPEYRVYDVG